MRGFSDALLVPVSQAQRPGPPIRGALGQAAPDRATPYRTGDSNDVERVHQVGLADGLEGASAYAILNDVMTSIRAHFDG